MIEYDNARYGTLSGFFSCGSANRLRGSRASDLGALGFGWDPFMFSEQWFQVLFLFLICYNYL